MGSTAHVSRRLDVQLCGVRRRRSAERVLAERIGEAGDQERAEQRQEPAPPPDLVAAAYEVPVLLQDERVRDVGHAARFGRRGPIPARA